MEKTEIQELANSIENNNYNSIAIGTQIWMIENLNVSCFRNGDLITEAKTSEEWKLAAREKRPAWCYYDYNPVYGDVYGKLYNWYAVVDVRGLAPEGWHVTKDSEWKQLFKMRGKIFVDEGEHDSNSEELPNVFLYYKSGFSAILSGICYPDGKFGAKHFSGNFWIFPAIASHSAFSYRLSLDGDGQIYRSFEHGLSVRCIKNNKYNQRKKTIKKSFGLYLDPKFEKSFKTVKIGRQEWMLSNLDSTHFQNGDIISTVWAKEDWDYLCDKGEPASCFYNFDSDMGKIYGRLYNFYAVNDPRGIAPVGWRVASGSDVNNLINYLGGELVAGGKMMDNTSALSEIEKYAANNESGFTALPGCTLGHDGFEIGEEIWWTSSHYHGGLAWAFGIYGDEVEFFDVPVDVGLSVRCIK